MKEVYYILRTSSYSDLMERGSILLVDKPIGWTSFDVVKKVRSALHIQKIGHAGTLDPLATGLLLLCTGQQTKKVGQLQAYPKTYKGQMVLGKTTPSMDLETAFDSESNYNHITEAMVKEAVAAFIGTITQIPPLYSATHINGKRAYTMARKGQLVTLAPRSVVINDFILKVIDLPFISFELICGKGTYVRSLVNDLGKKLGVGAYLHKLCRTQIGSYHLDQASSVEELLQNAKL